MQVNRYPERLQFGLLPEPEGRRASFVTSAVINLSILALMLYVGMMAKRVIEQHKFEQTELIFPTTPPPQPRVHTELPKPPDLPKPPEVKLAAPRINTPRPVPQPAMKPVEMEAKMNAPEMKAARPSVVLSPQPKAALTAAAPAQVKQEHVSTAAVHLGETFGAKPNPNATRPATIAALGNPYGGMRGEAAAPRGVVGSTGIGNGVHAGSNAGTMGRVAQTGLPGGTGTASRGTYGGGRVASAGIPSTVAAATPLQQMKSKPQSTNLEVLSKPPVRYTAEAKQLGVQGDVILRVTFTANGHVLVHGVVHGLGHGLDQEAERVAEQIRFKPATRNGQPVDLTTNITITFQLA